MLVRVLLAAQRPAEAIALARNVQRERAGEAAGWLLEGEVEEARARWGRAVEVYRAGLERTQASALAVRLHHAWLQQSPAEAERFANGRLRDHPGDAEFRLYLAQRALAAGRDDEAERHYAVLRTQVPENATVLNNLAWLHLRLGRPDAVELARRADALAPNTPAILDTLAAALAGERRFDEALRAQQRAVELSGDAELRLALARLYATSGAPARARVELEALAALGERFARQSEVAALQRELGR
jgi:tetratricopeptide (TPR) repeat protein